MTEELCEARSWTSIDLIIEFCNRRVIAGLSYTGLGHSAAYASDMSFSV